MVVKMTLPQLTAQTVLSHSPVALLIDYDGTLTPIVDDPTAAQLSPEGLATLARVAQAQPGLSLGIISGRSVEQLQGFLLGEGSPLRGLPLVLSGLHGGQLYAEQDQRWLLRQEATALAPVLDTLKTALHHWQSETHTPLTLERKAGANLAVHYRHCPPAIYATVAQQLQALATATLTTALAQAGLPATALRLQTGDCVLEWLPTGQHKGHAVRQLLGVMQADHAKPLTPIVLGDDTTDEAAFEAAKTLGGFGVRVGEWQGETYASYGLPNCKAVHAFLADVLN